jgi:DNA-binding MarR family transcriptional regulator
LTSFHRYRFIFNDMNTAPSDADRGGDALAPFESEMRAFLLERGVDLDAQAVVFLLYRAWAAVLADLEARALRGCGVTHAGFAILMTLWFSGPRETRALARGHHTSKAAVVNVVNTLERDGLVTRTRSVIDKRLVTVALTDAGRATVERAQAAVHARERRLAAALTRDEQRQLARLLRRVGEAARAAAREDER